MITVQGLIRKCAELITVQGLIRKCAELITVQGLIRKCAELILHGSYIDWKLIPFKMDSFCTCTCITLFLSSWKHLTG
jgi:hypothetical protein